MTVRDWIREATERFASAGFESPRLEADMLAAHTSGVERVWLVTHPEAEFPELAGETLVQRRLRHEPLAYILGWREFYGRRFLVRPGVLIPRQDTETLIEAALPYCHSRSVLDIGTGSGCIAITLALESSASVTAVDLSDVALDVARQNAVELGAHLEIVRSDLFERLGGRMFDLIVSNPPYIADSEKLMPDVVDYEPLIALFSGPTGLEVYERIASESGAYLNPGGLVLVEIGYTQAGAVSELFKREGWVHEETIKDMSGNDRVMRFSRAS